MASSNSSYGHLDTFFSANSCSRTFHCGLTVRNGDNRIDLVMGTRFPCEKLHPPSTYDVTSCTWPYTVLASLPVFDLHSLDVTSCIWPYTVLTSLPVFDLHSPDVTFCIWPTQSWAHVTYRHYDTGSVGQELHEKSCFHEAPAVCETSQALPGREDNWRTDWLLTN